MDVIEKFKLEGRVSVITGAAQGLGRAMAQALAQVGSHIVIADIDIEKAEESTAKMRKYGVDAIAVKTDVTDKAQVDKMTEEVMNHFGHIDILVNNAGIAVHEKAEDMEYDDWLKVMDVNLNGVFLVSQAVGRIMIKQKSGSIINISSMSGVVSNTPQCQCSYNASKAGVIMLTKSLAGEWAQHNLRVNAIAPGYMKTELTKPFFEKGGDSVEKWMMMTPMGRPGEPEELDGLVVYLASDASSYCTGGVYMMDGGYTAW